MGAQITQKFSKNVDKGVNVRNCLSAFAEDSVIRTQWPRTLLSTTSLPQDGSTNMSPGDKTSPGHPEHGDMTFLPKLPVVTKNFPQTLRCVNV